MFLPANKGCDLFVDNKCFKHNAIFSCVKLYPRNSTLKRGQLQQQNYYNKNHSHLVAHEMFQKSSVND